MDTRWHLFIIFILLMIMNIAVYVQTRPRANYTAPMEIIIHDDLTGLEDLRVESELEFLGPGKKMSPIIRLLPINDKGDK